MRKCQTCSATGSFFIDHISKIFIFFKGPLALKSKPFRALQTWKLFQLVLHALHKWRIIDADFASDLKKRTGDMIWRMGLYHASYQVDDMGLKMTPWSTRQQHAIRISMIDDLTTEWHTRFKRKPMKYTHHHRSFFLKDVEVLCGLERIDIFNAFLTFYIYSFHPHQSTKTVQSVWMKKGKWPENERKKISFGGMELKFQGPLLRNVMGLLEYSV